MATIYRCNAVCPIKRHCFLVKTLKPLPGDTVLLAKCPHLHKDIPLLAKDSIAKR